MTATGSSAAHGERRLLLLSATATLAMSVTGIGMGLAAGSKAVVFDGMYEVVDAGMTLAAWVVAGLVVRGADRRFQYGYWHLEPLLAFLNGAILLFACFYAAVGAFSDIVSGGRRVALDIGIAYAATSAVVSFAVFAYVRRKGRSIGSSLLALDSRSWLVGGAMSSGPTLSFAIAAVLDGAGMLGAAAYADPAILLLLVVILSPLPIATLVRSGREILRVAPPDLDARIDGLARDTARRHGFADHRSYVTQAGRAHFIEIGFVTSQEAAGMTVRDLDAIRAEIATAIGPLGPGCWLTIQFTTDLQWI